MNLKKIGIVLFLVLFLFPLAKIQAETSNAGFIPANIWYSKDPFQEGDKIKIYTLIFNPDSRELSGTVNFFDKTVFLGKKDFKVPAKGVKDISIDWTATVGDHTIFGKIENAKFLVSKDKYEVAYLAKDETEQSKRTVSKKIIPKETSTDSNSELNTNNPGQIESIRNLIVEKTPDFIAKPISATAIAIEGFRESVGTASENKKQEIKVELKNLDENSKIVTDKTAELENNVTPTNLQTKLVSENKSSFLKPFKYVELFALTLASGIFNNKLIFYGILVVGIFLIFRLIWIKIF